MFILANKGKPVAEKANRPQEIIIMYSNVAQLAVGGSFRRDKNPKSRDCCCCCCFPPLVLPSSSSFCCCWIVKSPVVRKWKHHFKRNYLAPVGWEVHLERPQSVPFSNGLMGGGQWGRERKKKIFLEHLRALHQVLPTWVFFGLVCFLKEIFK